MTRRRLNEILFGKKNVSFSGTLFPSVHFNLTIKLLCQVSLCTLVQVAEAGTMLAGCEPEKLKAMAPSALRGLAPLTIEKIPATVLGVSQKALSNDLYIYRVSSIDNYIQYTYN